MTAGRKITVALALAASSSLAAGRVARADDIAWGGQIDGGPVGKGEKRKAFDPDTTLRLTGDELAARGATNLAEALDLLPDVQVRTSGRGGMQLDIRGGRKGWVKVLVDGVPVDDPFYGSFDISSIPVTDIAEIRVSSAPASPLDGAGGPGGLIEVITVRATGKRRIEARAQAGSAPSAAGWVTGRSTLGGNIGVRASAGGTYGGRDYDVLMPDMTSTSLGEDKRSGNAALRVESTTDRGTVGLDLWGQHRSYVVPPGDDAGADVLAIDGEDMARLSLWGETATGGWSFRGAGYGQLLRRDSRNFADASMSTVQTRENLAADRIGVGAWANRALGGGLELVLSGTVDTESADVSNLMGLTQGGRSTFGEAAAGLQWRSGPWRIDGAAGLAVPDGATPWPEAKLTLGWKPIDMIDVSVIGARKGRVPTLRERYQLNIGNDELEPETSTSADVGVTVKPDSHLTVKLVAFDREIDQMIRLDVPSSMLVNIGQVSLHGVDASVDYSPIELVSGGVSWAYIDASSENAGDEPLDFLPHNRVDGHVTLKVRARAGFTGRVRWVDTRLDNGTTLPSYTTADASGFYRFRQDLRATLKVDNLADQRNELRANGYRDPGRVIMLGVEGVWE